MCQWTHFESFLETDIFAVFRKHIHKYSDFSHQYSILTEYHVDLSQRLFLCSSPGRACASIPGEPWDRFPLGSFARCISPLSHLVSQCSKKASYLHYNIIYWLSKMLKYTWIQCFETQCKLLPRFVQQHLWPVWPLNQNIIWTFYAKVQRHNSECCLCIRTSVNNTSVKSTKTLVDPYNCVFPQSEWRIVLSLMNSRNLLHRTAAAILVEDSGCI